MPGFSVRFRTIRCRRCDEFRQATRPCHSCGARPAPTEVDDHWQRRVRLVRASADQTVPLKEAIPPLEVFQSLDLAGYPKRVFAAADAVNDDADNAVERWQAVAAEAQVLTDWVKTARPLRPLVQLTRAVSAAASAAARMFDAAAAALTEPDMRSAQAKTADLQRALDDAASAAGAVGELVDVLRRVEDSEDVIGAWLAEVLAGDPMSAFERGRELFRARVAEPCGDSTAFLVLVWDRLISVIGDPDRFWAIVLDHRQVLLAHQANVAEVVNDPLYAERVDVVAHDLWSAARRASVAEPLTSREAASELMDVAHTVVEQALKFHLGVACSATTKMSFGATQAGDVSYLANLAADRGWQAGLATAATPFRNAFAHRDYEVKNGVIALSAKAAAARGAKPIEVSSAELQDAVLDFTELNGAMEVALASVVEQEFSAGTSSIPTLHLLRSILIGLGWTRVEVSAPAAEDVLVLAQVPGPLRLSALSFVAAPLVTRSVRVRLDLQRSDTGAHCVVTLSTAAFGSWMEATGADKEMAFIQLCRRTTVDSVPIMSSEQAGKFIALRTLALVTSEGLDARQRKGEITRWRVVADEAVGSSLGSLIGRAQRWRIYADGGLRPDVEELRPLMDIADSAVGELQDTLL